MDKKKVRIFEDTCGQDLLPLFFGLLLFCVVWFAFFFSFNVFSNLNNKEDIFLKQARKQN
jgi:hypothetical protein